MSPADFIPLAEQSGLIPKLGRWVLEEACREAKRREQAGWTSLKISVNVSAKQFKQPESVDVVKDVLKDTGLGPRKLCIQITESVVIDKQMFTLKMLDEPVALGVDISIDDFGTGYSSLSLLRQPPIPVIKIDQSFIAEMVEEQSVRSVVAAMTTMSHHLGKTVVAEGIESEQQMAWLREMGCDNGHGYFIDKPLTAELMQARLTNIS
ncbi:EAL domain, c-di-GMP-specific phosphodiesterase class I (or its enzymatically inactive variant) [Paenibacillus sp. UNC496MF]|nr:EAL domain, c-di-GMP-specific phosphodiesterase class I (or its enzymatically inactive variant) [Paenibacillus sp. UNC496MF]